MTQTAAGSKAFILLSDLMHLHFQSTEQGILKDSLYYCNLQVVFIEMHYSLKSQKSDFILVNCFHLHHCCIFYCLPGHNFLSILQHPIQIFYCLLCMISYQFHSVLRFSLQDQAVVLSVSSCGCPPLGEYGSLSNFVDI